MFRKFLLAILVLLVLTPAISFLMWYFSPKKPFTVAIVDKTVMTDSGQEHISLNWVLNHTRFIKTAESRYDPGSDYFGFFPKEDTVYDIKGLERFSDEQLNVLSDDADMLFITDTYGVYKQEWYAGYAPERFGVLYGGLSKQDLTMMRLMKKKNKLVIAEFNCLASPTTQGVQDGFQDEFGVSFTGWTGRFFDSLDPEVNLELPVWAVENYKSEHNGNWPFTKAGLVLVNQTGSVEVLEEDTDLEDAMPFIIATKEGQDLYNMPEKEKYPFWFEIVNSEQSRNTTYANFKLFTNDRGKDRLSKLKIPSEFPAVVSHTGADYDFYYFAADFSDNPIGYNTSYFKGIGLLDTFFYNKDALTDRGGFFFNFYKPMLTAILTKAYENK